MRVETAVEATQFIDDAFSIIQPLVDGIIEHNRINTEGFEVSDVRWLEASPNAYPRQLCRLQWRDVTLLRVELSMLGERFQLETNWHAHRH
jgi:hypothetical protein